MYKKLILGLIMLCAGSCVFAIEQYNLTFKGFQNLEKKQQLAVINNLQAIADNDDVEFSKSWPSSYFVNGGVSSYVYMAKNGTDSFDIIKFDMVKPQDNCSLREKTPDFCIPTLIPNLTSYVYNERLIVDYTPDFINDSSENVVFEVVMRDGKYIGDKVIRNNIQPKDNDIFKNCNLESAGDAKICKAFDQKTDKVVYTEHLILKDPKGLATPENAFKYIKYDIDGKKMEEYSYASGKHVYYDEKGNITQLIQWKDDKFKYFNVKLPDLYLDVDLIRDANGRVIEELYNDRNRNVMRRYVGEFAHGNVAKIHVYDVFHKADWIVEPTRKQSLSSPDFSIRY